jgi:hypothetical protein
MRRLERGDSHRGQWIQLGRRLVRSYEPSVFAGMERVYFEQLSIWNKCAKSIKQRERDNISGRIRISLHISYRLTIIFRLSLREILN